MATDIRREMAASLSRLADCLGELGLDSQGLKRYPQEVQGRRNVYKIVLEYCWESREAKVPDKVRPSDAEVLEITLKFDATFAATAVDFAAECDPFETLQVDILMRCLGGDAEYRFAWHIDRHGLPNQPGEVGAPAALHPCYHVQAGGKVLREQLDSGSGRYGHILLVEAPRIPLPPMDPVLAVDFAFSQFDGASWTELRKKEPYKDTVRQSQQRYWRRYYAALHRHFGDESGEWSPLVLHPGLVPPPSRRVTR